MYLRKRDLRFFKAIITHFTLYPKHFDVLDWCSDKSRNGLKFIKTPSYSSLCTLIYRLW